MHTQNLIAYNALKGMTERHKILTQKKKEKTQKAIATNPYEAVYDWCGVQRKKCGANSQHTHKEKCKSK